MAKSVKAAKEVVGTTIDALVKEGKALAKIWKATNSMKDSTKANGFDTRLGKLMQELKAQSTLDSGQISRQTLVAHGIHTIDRRRRSEALWFVENETAARDFMAKSKKGYTSLSALQKAMAADAKPAAKAKPSDVGQSADAKPAAKADKPAEKRTLTVQISRTKMVDTIVSQCELHNLDLETIINDLQSRLAKQLRKSA